MAQEMQHSQVILDRNNGSEPEVIPAGNVTGRAGLEQFARNLIGQMESPSQVELYSFNYNSRTGDLTASRASVMGTKG